MPDERTPVIAEHGARGTCHDARASDFIRGLTLGKDPRRESNMACRWGIFTVPAKPPATAAIQKFFEAARAPPIALPATSMGFLGLGAGLALAERIGEERERRWSMARPLELGNWKRMAGASPAREAEAIARRPASTARLSKPEARMFLVINNTTQGGSS